MIYFLIYISVYFTIIVALYLCAAFTSDKPNFIDDDFWEIVGLMIVWPLILLMTALVGIFYAFAFVFRFIFKYFNLAVWDAANFIKKRLTKKSEKLG